MSFLRIIIVGVVCLAGCSTIAVDPSPPPDALSFAPAVTLRVCILRDITLAPADARAIMASLKTRFSPYGLALEFPWMRDWQRPAFRHAGILEDITRRPLEAPCDRLLAFVGRDARDFMWGVFLPEVLGAVETRTHAKGYVVAQTGSFNQVLAFTPPREAAAHELFHMLGINHDEETAAALRRMARIRQLALENRRAGRDFFPAVASNGTVYHTRRAVDRRFGIVPAQTCLAQAGGDRC